jgi:hypothetical protein
VRQALVFNNGVSTTVDLKDKLNGDVFLPLKDLCLFQSFTVKYNTIEWSNGADMAPEYLYELSLSKT